MPEYLTPGVYVEEIDTGSKAIEGVSTSTVGFLGLAERGPLKAMYVTSFTQFNRMYGTYYKFGEKGELDAYLTYSVEGFFQNGGKRCYVARVAAADAGIATLSLGGLTVNAVGPGGGGNRIAVKLAKSEKSGLFTLSVFHWAPTITVEGLDGTGTLIDPTQPISKLTPDQREKRKDPTLVEVYEQLSPLESSPNSFVSRINDVSDLIAVTVDPAAEPTPTADAEVKPLTGGKDGGKLELADFQGAEAGELKTGLLGLKEIDDISILCCPDQFAIDASVEDELVNQCENQKDRFAIIQPKANEKLPSTPVRASKYSATYFPWLKVSNPRTGEIVDVPPCGHVAGIYARSDTDRGVHKAPANELVRGITDLKFKISKDDQAALNPNGVNAIRYFKGAGNLVWGARTTIAARDSDWKYVNVRRLFIFVEKSIERATQWVVFEPNDEPLWARLRRTVSAFLTRMWMDGMLQGAKKEQAYFVRCDRTTMTQADIDNGKLIMLIGIAPVKPAEFVIFRIGQWDGGSEVSEV